ncbi:hypothetical protein M9E62_001902 [Salmonella enterica]|nr:hypothetical protein [Salmonella enterica]EJF9758147.1 hypothetical protein [Salmonella enterica]EKA6116821.1 hypothetical protein [Salmonella enterica]
MVMRNLLLHSDWKQLTDGNKKLKIQVTSGFVRYTEADTAPGDDTAFFTLNPGLYVVGPDISYVRADSETAFIVLSDRVAS